MPPNRQALFYLGLAGVEVVGVSIWMATVPAVDTLWLALPLALLPFAFHAAPWRTFRSVCFCFCVGGLLIPASIVDVFLCWFFLLSAGGFLFLAGGASRPPSVHEASSARPVDWVQRALLVGILVDAVLSAVWWTVNPHDGDTLITVVWMVWPGLAVLLIPLWPRTAEHLRVTCNSLAGALPLFATGGLLFGWAPMIFAPPPLLTVAGSGRLVYGLGPPA